MSKKKKEEFVYNVDRDFANDGFLDLTDERFAKNGLTVTTTKPYDIHTRVEHQIFKDFYLNIEICDTAATMPRRANDSDAGMDVFSTQSVTVLPNSDVLIPLGWKCEFPAGYVLLFWEKSGVATKMKLDIGAAVVDAGYRGIVHCHMFNNSDKAVFIEQGQKIAQFLIMPVWHGQARQVKSVLKDSTRGEGGFGSTGDKA